MSMSDNNLVAKTTVSLAQEKCDLDRRIKAQCYDANARAALPDLEPELWHTILHLFAGTSGMLSGSAWTYLMTTVFNALEDTRDPTELQKILNTLSRLSESEAAATLDLNELYWSGHEEAQALANRLMGME